MIRREHPDVDIYVNQQGKESVCRKVVVCVLGARYRVTYREPTSSKLKTSNHDMAAAIMSCRLQIYMQTMPDFAGHPDALEKLFGTLISTSRNQPGLSTLSMIFPVQRLMS